MDATGDILPAETRIADETMPSYLASEFRNQIQLLDETVLLSSEDEEEMVMDSMRVEDADASLFPDDNSPPAMSKQDLGAAFAQTLAMLAGSDTSTDESDSDMSILFSLQQPPRTNASPEIVDVPLVDDEIVDASDKEEYIEIVKKDAMSNEMHAVLVNV
jgi:hypothetical protein